MQLDKIISIAGRPGLFEVHTQTRTGVVATSLIDGKRINANARNQVSLLSEINIYGLEKEVPLQEVLTMIHTKEEGKQCSVKPKSPRMSWKPISLMFFRIMTKNVSTLLTSKRSFNGTIFWPKKRHRFLLPILLKKKAGKK